MGRRQAYGLDPDACGALSIRVLAHNKGQRMTGEMSWAPETWACSRYAVNDPHGNYCTPSLPVMLIRRDWLGPILEYKLVYEPIEDES
jgi:hypothetical protein